MKQSPLHQAFVRSLKAEGVELKPVRDVWAEINARPSKLRPFGSALQGVHSVEPLATPELVGKTRRLRSEPPCSVCGNRSAWRCHCEDDAA